MDGAPWDWAAIHSRRGYLAALAAVALLYVATAKFGLLLAFSTKQVTALWPPTGVAFAGLVLLGTRAWPAVFLGAFLANVTTDESLLTAAGIAVGNTLGPAVAVSLARRVLSFDAKLERVRDAVGIGVFGAIGMLIPASSGVVQLVLADVISWSAYGSVWWVWWVGDATGLIVVAPLILTWVVRPHLRYSRRQLAELMVLFSGLTFIGVVVLTEALHIRTASLALKYLIFPFVIWAAVRFTPRETATAIAIVAAVALWGLLHDHGPFIRGTLDERLIFLQLFITAVCLTGLSLSAAMAERRTAEEDRRLSAERFAALVDASAQIVWSSCATGAVVESSPSWCAFTGQSEEQRAGWGWLDAIHPDDRGMVAALWHKAIDTRTTVATAYRIHHAGGA